MIPYWTLLMEWRYPQEPDHLRNMVMFDRYEDAVRYEKDWRKRLKEVADYAVRTTINGPFYRDGV